MKTKDGKRVIRKRPTSRKVPIATAPSVSGRILSNLDQPGKALNNSKGGWKPLYLDPPESTAEKLKSRVLDYLDAQDKAVVAAAERERTCNVLEDHRLRLLELVSDLSREKVVLVDDTLIRIVFGSGVFITPIAQRITRKK